MCQFPKTILEQLDLKTLTQILDRKWSDKFEYVVNIVYGQTLLGFHFKSPCVCVCALPHRLLSNLGAHPISVKYRNFARVLE